MNADHGDLPIINDSDYPIPVESDEEKDCRYSTLKSFRIQQQKELNAHHEAQKNKPFVQKTYEFDQFVFYKHEPVLYQNGEPNWPRPITRRTRRGYPTKGTLETVPFHAYNGLIEAEATVTGLQMKKGSERKCHPLSEAQEKLVLKGLMEEFKLIRPKTHVVGKEFRNKDDSNKKKIYEDFTDFEETVFPPDCEEKKRILISEDISGGEELLPIPAYSFDEEDQRSIGPHFLRYVTRNFVPVPVADQEGFKKMHVDVTCDCEDGCVSGNCACAIKNRQLGDAEILADGRILMKKDYYQTIVVSCGEKCACRGCCSQSLTHVLDKPLTHSYELFELGGKEKKKGFRVRLLNSVLVGSPVLEFKGEIMHKGNMKKMHEWDRQSDDYYMKLYDIAVDQFITKKVYNLTKPEKMMISKGLASEKYCLVINPLRLGNIGRYMNHGCWPNVRPVRVAINSLRPWDLRMVFIAAENIVPGSEICFDYGDHHHNGRTTSEKNCMCERQLCWKQWRYFNSFNLSLKEMQVMMKQRLKNQLKHVRRYKSRAYAYLKDKRYMDVDDETELDETELHDIATDDTERSMHERAIPDRDTPIPSDDEYSSLLAKEESLSATQLMRLLKLVAARMARFEERFQILSAQAMAKGEKLSYPIRRHLLEEIETMRKISKRLNENDKVKTAIEADRTKTTCNPARPLKRKMPPTMAARKSHPTTIKKASSPQRTRSRATIPDSSKEQEDETMPGPSNRVSNTRVAPHSNNEEEGTLNNPIEIDSSDDDDEAGTEELSSDTASPPPARKKLLTKTARKRVDYESSDEESDEESDGGSEEESDEESENGEDDGPGPSKRPRPTPASGIRMNRTPTVNESMEEKKRRQIEQDRFDRTQQSTSRGPSQYEENRTIRFERSQQSSSRRTRQYREETEERAVAPEVRRPIGWTQQAPITISPMLAELEQERRRQEERNRAIAAQIRRPWNQQSAYETSQHPTSSSQRLSTRISNDSDDESRLLASGRVPFTRNREDSLKNFKPLTAEQKQMNVLYYHQHGTYGPNGPPFLPPDSPPLYTRGPQATSRNLQYEEESERSLEIVEIPEDDVEQPMDVEEEMSQGDTPE